MSEDIQRIIETAIWAPSGDNSQPWRFVVKGNVVSVFNLPEKDNPILNVGQSGSHIAHGGLIENMVIASSQFGYKTDINFFPNKLDLTHIADVAFSKDKNIVPDTLYASIKERCTNRKAYKPTPLTDIQQKKIIESVGRFGVIDLVLEEGIGKRKILGEASSIMEQIALENRELHSLFFKDILWDKKIHEKGETGLYIKTLELPLPVQWLFKLLKHWRITKILNKIGFSKMAAKGNAVTYASGAATGIITIPYSSPENFIIAGRAMQRLWLTVTALDLSLQPVTGIVFLEERIKTGEFKNITSNHIALAESAYNKICSIFGVTKGVIAMMFRIGDAEKPTARTYRSQPNITKDLS